VAALTPLSVDGMIVAASSTVQADSRVGSRGGVMPWVLLVAESVASLAANVAVAEPTVTGRVIAVWPSFALIAAYELLMRQVRYAAEAGKSWQRASRPSTGASVARTLEGVPAHRRHASDPGTSSRREIGRDLQLRVWQ